jgi:hypothetical protein
MAGRKASAASCVSAAKTPTAETDSEGLEPRRGERSERGGSSANEVSKRRRRARQSGSGPGDSPGRTPTRTASRAGGLGQKCAQKGHFGATTSPSKPFLPAQAEGSMPEA